MKQKNKKRLSQYAVRYIRCQFIRKSIDRLRGSQSRKRYNQNFQNTITLGQEFLYRLTLYLILKYKSIIKMNLYLIVFIPEIIYLKKRMRHMLQILMSLFQQKLTGQLYMLMVIIYILIPLELNKFQKNFKKSQETKIS